MRLPTTKVNAIGRSVTSTTHRESSWRQVDKLDRAFGLDRRDGVGDVLLHDVGAKHGTCGHVPNTEAEAEAAQHCEHQQCFGSLTYENLLGKSTSYLKRREVVVFIAHECRPLSNERVRAC